MGGNDNSDASPDQARQSHGHDGLRGGMEMGFGLFYHEGITNANNAPKEEDYRSEFGDHRGHTGQRDILFCPERAVCKIRVTPRQAAGANLSGQCLFFQCVGKTLQRNIVPRGIFRPIQNNLLHEVCNHS